ncbi:hypothetical protein ACQEVC_20645 [Plantactinospora sp. CA-294935]|uniref:hypothetical protein n=1 Tax=Plantactinospora sp. CA-294935 TaxID=3240012 RepID=UPI003D8BC4AD
MGNTDNAADGLVPAEVLASTSPVAVSAVGRAKPGKDQEFEDLVRSVVPQVRAEHPQARRPARLRRPPTPLGRGTAPWPGSPPADG